VNVSGLDDKVKPVDGSVVTVKEAASVNTLVKRLCTVRMPTNPGTATEGMFIFAGSHRCL
jgi:hypothetical protein